MSKINAIRLINLSYNNSAIRISDETFQMHGESTLLSLCNGGGKSVLVQMMIAPFVHPRYRNAKDRPFESYFVTSKPTFILVEWALDGGAGYVMTGMMVRRRQDMSEESADNLEIIQFISEYQHACPQDIYHLPVVEKNRREMVLKNFAACRQLFDSYKKDRSISFYSYDMGNSAQARQYFDKLLEYQINYKEWETIIKKINLTESGLSYLFSDCRDEKGLVEKWFLESVESKLNKEQNRMKEFQNIIEKYVGQYKDNQSKIQRRDTIRRFREEAEGILATAESYRRAEETQQEKERQIGVFLWSLGRAAEQAARQQEELDTRLAQIQASRAQLQYQQISKAVYEAREAERYQQANREMIRIERDTKEREYEQILDQLHLLELARQQAEADAQRQECIQYEQQLQVLGKKEEDFREEREQLGYTLRCYYQRQCDSLRVQIREQQEELAEYSEKQKSEEARLDSLQRQQLEQGVLIGSVQARIQEYDAREDQYNRRYPPGFTRNILGAYEPAALELRQQEYEKEQEELRRSYQRTQREIEETQWQQREAERNLEDAKGERMQKEAECREAVQLCERYEAELAERRKLLRYFGLSEDMLFEREQILSAADKRLAELEAARRSLELEEDKLQREYQRLTQGRVLELPEEFEQMLQEAGITYVYGMEWLRKNQYTQEKNELLVREHPFLPYALILTAKDMERLSELADPVFTSSPIPIIVREQLEQDKIDDCGTIVKLSGVSFYILFNRHLLDEAQLRAIIQDKERQLERKREQIQQRREEYESYYEIREKLRRQDVTRESQDAALQRRKELEEGLEQLAADIIRRKEELEQLSGRREELQEAVQRSLRQLSSGERRLEDLAELMQSYESYLKQRERLADLQQEQQHLQEQEQLVKSILAKLREQIHALELSRERLLRQESEASNNLAVYEQYEAAGEMDGDIRELESRYQAITSQLSLQQQELEQQLARAREKYQKRRRELERIRKKYNVEPDAWLGTEYDVQTEEYQEQMLREREQQLELKRAQWNEADKNTALATQRLEQQNRLLWETCQQTKPLPQEEILPVDFAAEMEKCGYEMDEIGGLKREQQKRQGWYEENMTALAEYEEFIPADTEHMDEQALELEEHTGEELRRSKGMLIRDLRQCIENRQRQKEQLTAQLNKMVRREDFADDFYHKPIEAMLSLTDQADQVIRQLNTTLQSYDTLMEKIQVDISIVEEEKERIAELLEEYIHEVHRNLGKIDYNSTITIRERAVKMLKITLPDWEENGTVYRIRIRDFVDELTMQGIALLEQNENIQEYIGAKVTTKNLYDVVVGISDVQIRLYKVEAQREYPITWSEVARNSGGEGFLSAFVILSSLLYYMRRDDTDLFADRNEGKVLVMDNPFAQTNAVHLLKPLFDMARKTNTQMICLTGLGGDSIYNRFDNIYVLNLIAANLRNGTQYLKAEHIRGREEETMVVSQIEVFEQQELAF